MCMSFDERPHDTELLMPFTSTSNSLPLYSPCEHKSIIQCESDADSCPMFTNCSPCSPPNAASHELIDQHRGFEFRTLNDDSIHKLAFMKATRRTREDNGWTFKTLRSGAILATPPDVPPEDHTKCEDELSEIGSKQIELRRSPANLVSRPSITVKLPPIPYAPHPMSQKEVDDFLDDLGKEFYINILQKLCPDNMRGTYCRTPEECISNDLFFACPEYAIRKHCKHTSTGRFSHFGFKHTLNGCMVKDNLECLRYDRQLGPCRVEVVYFHVRASCITLRGGKRCQAYPCHFGHDYPEIRRAVMSQGR